MIRRLICVALIALGAIQQARAQATNEEGLKLFEQKIRPVLVAQCYSCHSVAAREAKKLQGGLYLDSAAGMVAGGENGAGIVKGKSAERLVVKALKPKHEINLAEGRQWWSFQPLQAVAPPEVPEGALIRTPIDRFVVARQRAHGLTPNLPATKEKLIRRAYFDLIGLPPTPEQVEA